MNRLKLYTLSTTIISIVLISYSIFVPLYIEAPPPVKPPETPSEIPGHNIFDTNKGLTEPIREKNIGKVGDKTSKGLTEPIREKDIGKVEDKNVKDKDSFPNEDIIMKEFLNTAVYKPDFKFRAIKVLLKNIYQIIMI